ncbi:MAG: two-component system OmpR family phosphate regulon sensor histidine kinase PhoR [Limisphaerales bacterium]|nr:MAG: two-component system OmpR family phosphate regulon sensor histidine kinase PhoR [Limisphaerales bacterium]TXT50066.1 MAG: two-component system OmpR family phosphate regulon sensor histidine kinase PhoR [Limisphaerales bacterium]
MWPTLTILALLAAGVCFVAMRRCREETDAERERQQREFESLRQQHEQARARELAQQQALFNSMSEGVLVLDAEGRVRLVNQALERLFGVTGDIRGRTVMEALRLHQVQELVNQTLVRGQVEDFELELPGLDGNRSLQVNSAVVLGSDGRQQGLILVCHDLTRLKQLENTRREFVANVSHELRTPLSMIKGYVETLIDGAKDKPEVAMKFLQTIEKHADRLTYLIEDLLTISRLESGQIVMNLQRAELRGVAEHVRTDLESRAAAKQVKLLNEIPADTAANADAERLQQVLFNLVDNAIKYGRAGGCVIIGARGNDKKQVELWVRDDGPGIPPEAQTRVFERFYRVDKARSRDAGGTGLGLAIVKHIVQSHGGEVWVESEPGQGAAFYFTLPAA